MHRAIIISADFFVIGVCISRQGKNVEMKFHVPEALRHGPLGVEQSNFRP